MPGVLYQYLSNDHDRLDALLTRAAAKPGIIDMEPYSEFRKGILRHISMEEKIVLPAIARWQGGRKLQLPNVCAWITAQLCRCLCPRQLIQSFSHFDPSLKFTIRSKNRKAVCTNCWKRWRVRKRRKFFANSRPRPRFRYCPITRNPMRSKRPGLPLRGRVTNYGIRGTGEVIPELPPPSLRSRDSIYFLAGAGGAAVAVLAAGFAASTVMLVAMFLPLSTR